MFKERTIGSNRALQKLIADSARTLIPDVVEIINIENLASGVAIRSFVHEGKLIEVKVKVYGLGATSGLITREPSRPQVDRKV